MYGKDLYEDRLVRAIDRLYLLWVVATLGIPFALGYAVGGTWQRGLEAMLWGGLVRIFLFQHATFSVNSICHMFGKRDYPARDESRNNWFVALLVFGEGWHNNHHAFPASARHGLGRFQVDVSWWVIRGDGEAPTRLGREAARPAADQPPQARVCERLGLTVGSGRSGGVHWSGLISRETRHRHRSYQRPRQEGSMKGRRNRRSPRRSRRRRRSRSAAARSATAAKPGRLEP